MIVLRSLIYVVVFIYAFVLFFPKESFVTYLNEKLLKEHNVQVELELEKSFKGLSAQASTAFYNNNKAVTIRDISISPYVLYNTVSLENVKLEGVLGSFAPQNITNIDVQYTLLNPTKLYFTSKGEVGFVTGYLDLLSHKVTLNLEPSALMKKNYGFILNKATKKEENKFVYEYAL